MKEGKFHIHIENSRSSAPIFIATPEHIEALLNDHADLADQLHITIGSSAYDDLDRWSEEDYQDYYHQMRSADLLIGYSFPTANLRDYAPQLRMIHFISSGVDHMAPFDWVPDDLYLVNNRGVHLEKSGESFAMFLYMLNAGIPRLVTSQHQHQWNKLFTSVIKGKTLVVFGVGHQGGEMARQAKRLGMRVIGVDPYRKEHPECDRIVSVADMPHVLPEADFLALCAPLTEDTRGIIDGDMLDRLPEHAGLINAARGPLLDHRALHDRLVAGTLSGAVLDVFEIEPLPADHYLWDTPGLIMTPHVSSDDLIHYMPYTLDLALRNLRRLLADEPIVNRVDPQKAF